MNIPTTEAAGQLVAEKNTDELLAMLAQPDDWQSHMLDAAKAQLQQRGFEFVATPQALSDPEFDELQRVTDYRVLRKTLRSRGGVSIVWGLIAIGLGIAAIDIDRVNGILAGIGVFLTIEGIWLVVAPAPVGLLLDGFAVLIVGIWNIAVTVGVMSSGYDPNPLILLIGLAQIGWGCQSFFKYPHFSKMSWTEPSADTLRKLTQIADDLKPANMTSDPTLIEFVTKGRIGWKGQLRNTGAVFVVQRVRKLGKGLSAKQDLVFAAKQDVSFQTAGAGLAPSTLKMTFSIKDRRKSSGIMPQEAFARFEAWKVGIQKRPAVG